MHPAVRKLAPLYRRLRWDKRTIALERRVAVLESTVSALRHDSQIARIDLTALQAQISHLLSMAEVPSGSSDEYLRWKRDHPVPSEPLISVCVGTYNRAQLLTERCIASVLAQSYRNLELIVVGDGCTDDTEARVSQIDDSRLRFVNRPQRGDYPEDPMLRWMVAGTAPVNHAMSLANGDYVTHLDDDDEYLPARLEKLVAFATSEDCDFVWHPFFWEHSPGQWSLHEASQFALGQVTTSSVFYRSWFTRFGWNPEAYRLREPGDWNRFRRIQLVAHVAKRYPEPLLRHYRERSQSERSQ